MKIEPRCSERGKDRACEMLTLHWIFQHRDGVLDALTEQTGFTGINTLLDFGCYTVTKR